MPTPIIDYDDHVLQETPDDHRTPRFIAWFNGIIGGGIKRLNYIFEYFGSGSIDLGYWSSITTYNYQDKVRSGSGIVYESIACDSKGNSVANLNHDVSDTDWWFPILDYFVGVSEQASYTAQKLSFEYALNARFQKYLTDAGFVGYKQPTSIDAGVGYLPLSDIFLTNVATTFPSFVTYPTVTGCSIIYPSGSYGWIYPVPSYSSATLYRFAINIPNSVYLSLGATNKIRDSVIRNFADRINRAGIFYDIVTY